MSHRRKRTLVHWLSPQRRRRNRYTPHKPAQPATLGDVLSALEPSAGARSDQIDLAEWTRVVGPRLAAKSLPERTDPGGTLSVRVPSSAWAQELTFHTETIIERLRAAGHTVNRVRFAIGPISRRQKQRTAVERRRMIPLAHLPDTLQDAIDEVGDDRLRDILQRAASVSLGKFSRVIDQPEQDKPHRASASLEPSTDRTP